jgi:hypothetical protein
MSYYDSITAVESAVINLIKTDSTILQYVGAGSIQDSDYRVRLEEIYPGISIVLKKEPEMKQLAGMSNLKLQFQIRVYSGIIPLDQAKDSIYKIVSRIKEIFESTSKINSTTAFFDCNISNIDFDKEMPKEHFLNSSNNVSRCAEITLLTNSYITKPL